jgi:hypothetical protein
MLSRFLLLGLVSLTLGAAGNRWDEDTLAWWRNIEYLSSDQLQGRDVGSHGFDLAANYVATQYEKTGLQAAGDDGYFQKVWFTEASLVSAKVTIHRGGKHGDVAIPNEAQINFDAHSPAKAEGRVVFAGYGLKIPEADYDDFKGLPLKGAIVAYLAGSPGNINGNLRAHYGSSEVRWQKLRAAGAVGMIAIPNPKRMETPWPRMAGSWATPRMSLLDTDLNQFEGLQLSATWNPAMAENLMAGSGHTFAQILAAADHNRPLPHFETEVDLKSEVKVETHLVPSKNVVAVHPGTDDVLKDEYVIVSAHLDHLGMEKAGHSNHIFHGAIDNASGVSSVIEIAKKLKDVSTRRSILFLALTGEEKGELGSAYFARYPGVKGRIVADLNMDMFLPLIPLKRLEVQGLQESTLGADAEAVAEAAGIKVQADQEPGRNRFIRSDQYSFVKAGVPALAFKFGYQKGDAAEKIFENWYATRYHSVKDDSRQPMDVHAATEFNDLLKSLLVRVADADESPRWREDSFFRRFADPVAIAPGFSGPGN